MISIIYVNYKTASLVIDSIKSVKENTTGVDYEIIVVDNASGDYSLDLIRKQYPEVIYWKMKLETNRKVWNSEKIKRILK